MLNVKELIGVYLQEDVHFEIVNWAVENNLLFQRTIDNCPIAEREELALEILSTIGCIIVYEPQGDFSLTEGLCTIREIRNLSY